MVKIGFRSKRRMPEDKILENPRVANMPVMKTNAYVVDVPNEVWYEAINGDDEALDELQKAAIMQGVAAGYYDLNPFLGGGRHNKLGFRKKKQHEGMPIMIRDFEV